MRRGVVAVLAASMLATACSDNAPQVDPTGPDIGAPLPTATEPPSDDEWAVPEVITEDYARRVINELEREIAMFEAWIITSEPSEQPPDDVIEHLRRAYVPELIDGVVEDYVEGYAAIPPEDRGLSGQYFAETIIVHFADPACPLLEVTWDASQAERGDAPFPRTRSFIVIVRGDASPTGWLVKTSLSDVTEEELNDAIEEREESCG